MNTSLSWNCKPFLTNSWVIVLGRSCLKALCLIFLWYSYNDSLYLCFKIKVLMVLIDYSHQTQTRSQNSFWTRLILGHMRRKRMKNELCSEIFARNGERFSIWCKFLKKMRPISFQSVYFYYVNNIRNILIRFYIFTPVYIYITGVT